MEPSEHQRIRAALQEAGRLSGPEREEYLESADPSVRAEVRRLLRGDVQTGDLLPAPATPPPETCGPYRIERELGRGGMGVVYEGWRDDERVAVKILYPHLQTRERFVREAKLGQRVDHENVVRTLDAGEGYLVMEYVEGRTLRKMAQEWGTIPETLLREIARQVVDGLAAVHRANIVHRDLKPENILIDADQRVRIMDLGIAKALEASVALTAAGHFLGSLHYAAPEQWEGDIGPAADLYSLGVMLYELGTGTNPFALDTPGAVIKAHLDTEPPPASTVNPDISPFLSDVITTLLAKKPRDRFPSCAELRAALAEGERGSWWAERKRTRERPRIPVECGSPLRGRKKELAALREAWRRGGGAVLIEGEDGLGKTRLIAEFLREVDGAHILYGAFPPTGGMRGLTESIRSRFGTEEALRPYLSSTPRLVHAFSSFVWHEATEEIKGDALPAMCSHLLRALAKERPTIWILEDLHYAAEEARTIAATMARTGRGLLLLTSRPGLPEFDRLQRLTLERLERGQVVELVRDFDPEMAERLGPKIAERSSGVPLFALEMVCAHETEIPAAIRDLVDVRVRDLDADDRMLLDIAAVEGYEFEAALVARVLERPLVRVLQDLARLDRECGVVRPQGRRFRFDHHQVRAVLYEELAPRLREEYHALLAEVCEEDNSLFIGWHHLHGSRPHKGLPHVVVALGDLRRRRRHEDAIELADLALTHLDGEARVEILRRKASSLEVLGRNERAALDEALELAQTPEVRSRVLKSLAHHFARQSQYDEALDALREAEELAADNETLLAGLAGARGLVYHAKALYRESREETLRHLALAREIDDPRSVALATGRLAVAEMALANFDLAEKYFKECLTLCEEVGDEWTAMVTIGNQGVLAWRRLRAAEALRHYERYYELSRDNAYMQGQIIALSNLADISWRLGLPDASRPRLERALQLSREIDRPALYADTLLKIGELENDAMALKEAIEIYRRIGNKMKESVCLLAWGKQEEAIRAGKEGDAYNTMLLANAQLGNVAEVRRLLKKEARRIGPRQKMEALFRVWKKDGDPADLEASFRILEELRRHAPEPCHDTVITHVPTHAEIWAAWHAHQD